jgi:hypothetical protein
MSKEDAASVSIEQLIKSKVDPEDEFIPEVYANLILDGEKILNLNFCDKKSLVNLLDDFLVMLEL